MKINFVAYYFQNDGYGRFSSRLVAALLAAGVEVKPLLRDHLSMPPWLQQQVGIDWSNLTISCMPPFYLRPGGKSAARRPGPGQHWLLTMCESGRVPPSWVKNIQRSGVSRLLVPCQHNADAFAESGVRLPIAVVEGGVDPQEFFPAPPQAARPYTFLALGDRGGRKGHEEVFDAFYRAFGGKNSGVQDVRLIIKCRRGSNRVLRLVKRASQLDPRVQILDEDVAEMASLYARCDCLVIPSYCEGWGMPHREAAASGLSVITPAYSGMDDGHTEQWALVLRRGRLHPLPARQKAGLGAWLHPDVDEIADLMKKCHSEPLWAAQQGLRASAWLHQHQTWAHSAQKLIGLLEEKAWASNGMYHLDRV